MKIAKTTTISYYLSPQHKHISVLLPLKSGNVVAISIVGTPKHTTLHVLENITQ